MTQIAKVLKNNRGVKDPEIIYEDKLSNRKLVYKIVCKEDVSNSMSNSNSTMVNSTKQSATHSSVLSGSNSGSILSSSESSEDENDTEETRSKMLNSKSANGIFLNPHDVLKMTDPSLVLSKKRKRGRPTEFEKYFMPNPPKVKIDGKFTSYSEKSSL